MKNMGELSIFISFVGGCLMTAGSLWLILVRGDPLTGAVSFHAWWIGGAILFVGVLLSLPASGKKARPFVLAITGASILLLANAWIVMMN